MRINLHNLWGYKNAFSHGWIGCTFLSHVSQHACEVYLLSCVHTCMCEFPWILVAIGLCQCACWAAHWDTMPSVARPGVRKPTKEHTWLGTTSQNNHNLPSTCRHMHMYYEKKVGDIVQASVFPFVIKFIVRNCQRTMTLFFFFFYINNQLLLLRLIFSFHFSPNAHPESILEKINK